LNDILMNLKIEINEAIGVPLNENGIMYSNPYMKGTIWLKGWNDCAKVILGKIDDLLKECLKKEVEE